MSVCYAEYIGGIACVYYGRSGGMLVFKMGYEMKGDRCEGGMHEVADNDQCNRL